MPIVPNPKTNKDKSTLSQVKDGSEQDKSKSAEKSPSPLLTKSRQQKKEEKKRAKAEAKQAAAEAPPVEAAKKRGPLQGRKQTKREVIYPERACRICEGEKALTVAEAKKLLGWLEESETMDFKAAGITAQILDRHGKKVAFLNNPSNRPIYKTIYETLIQEILRKKWRLNGEVIIIGKTGLVLDGQHTLIALILAEQERGLHPAKWTDYWKHEPTIERFINFGIDEDDSTVNTINTGKPRSMADVIYRSSYFANVPVKARKAAARMADHAIRLLWHRTGASADAFAPRRTHAESLDFLGRHERLLEAIKHIYEENGEDNNIGRYLTPGYAAALLYLQGSATTEREREDNQGYSQVSHPSEEQLDWSLWDKAQEFWVLLAANHASMAAVKAKLSTMLEAGNGSTPERLGLLVKAWNQFSTGKKITSEHLELSYELDTNIGLSKLAETPIVGGIDLGNPE